MENSMNIDRYIQMAEENFSGADGYQNSMLNDLQIGVEGEYGVNGSAGYQYAGGQSGNGYYYADANQAGNDVAHLAHQVEVAAKTPAPYLVNVSNTTSGTLNLVMFGMNTYLLSPNFGSDTGLVVTTGLSNVSYLQLLQQSASQNFETSLVRVNSASNQQVTQTIELTARDANGQSVTVPVVAQSYFSANQFQAGIVDIPFSFKIDGNTYLTTPVFGNTSVTYTFFPSSKINPARMLGGGSSMQAYGAPVVPVAVPMFTATPIGLNRSRPLMINPDRR